MQCFECDGEFEQHISDEIAGWGKYKQLVHNVESFVCQECGEKMFSMDVVKELQDIAQKGLKQFEETEIYQVGQIVKVDDLTVDFTSEADLFVIESSYYDEENNLYYSICRLSDNQVWIDVNSSQILY